MSSKRVRFNDDVTVYFLPDEDRRPDMRELLAQLRLKAEQQNESSTDSSEEDDEGTTQDTSESEDDEEEDSTDCDDDSEDDDIEIVFSN